MATETRTFYPGEYDKSKSNVSSITNATNPVGKGSSNTSYASISVHLASVYAFWPFDVSVIPRSATIDSVVCEAKAKITSTSNCSGNLQLYSGTTEKGSATRLTTTVATREITCGTWTRDELGSICLRTYIYSNRQSTEYLYFYGADLTVTYTYQSQKFMLKTGGAWADVARVFKKVSGIWVEQTDLANVIEDGVRYQNGGEYVSPYKTVTVTGSGEDSEGYFHSSVSIGGIQYKSATTLQVEPGTVVTINTYQHAIYLNGVLVAAQAMFNTYEHTVTSDCSINLVNSGVESVTITTL